MVDHQVGGGAGGAFVVGRSAAAATPLVTPRIVPAQSADISEDLREKDISIAPKSTHLLTSQNYTAPDANQSKFAVSSCFSGGRCFHATDRRFSRQVA